MTLLLGKDRRVGKWVASRLGTTFFPPFTAIGLVDEGEGLCGGVVFHDWNGANIEITVVLERQIKRSEIRGLRHYVFEQLGARRATFRTLASNRLAILFLSRHAKFEAVLEDWFPEGSAWQFAVLRDDPRWMRWRVEI